MSDSLWQLVYNIVFDIVFHVYRKVVWLYMYMYIFIFFKIFSFVVYYKMLNMVPCVVQGILVTYFPCGGLCLRIPYSQFVPSLLPFW